MNADPVPPRHTAAAGNPNAGWAAQDFADQAGRFFAWFDALRQSQPIFACGGLFLCSGAATQLVAHSLERGDLFASLVPLASAASGQNQLKLSVIQGAATPMTAMAMPLAGTHYAAVVVLDGKLVEAGRHTALLEAAIDQLATVLARDAGQPAAASKRPAALADSDLLDLLQLPDDGLSQAWFTRLMTLLAPDQGFLALVRGRRIRLLRSSQAGDHLAPGSRTGQARIAALLAASGHGGTLLTSRADKRTDVALAALAAEEGVDTVLTVALRWRQARLVWMGTWDRSGAYDPQLVEALEPQIETLAAVLDATRPPARGPWFHKVPTWFDIRNWQLWSVLVATALVVWLLLPAPFHVIGQASLRSAEQRALVAPRDGFLSAVHVRPGDTVRQGDLLAEFDTRELTLRRARIDAQIEQAETRRLGAMAEFKTAMVQVSNAEIAAMAAERDLTELLLDQSRLTAQEDGLVISGDMAERVGTAVRHGEPMFEIAPAAGYMVSLEIPQKDVTETTIGQRGALRLTALPFDSFPIELERVSLAPDQDNGAPGFVGLASMDASHEAFRPGMGGVAQIEAGQAPRAWVLLRDVVYWAQMQWWRWVP